MEKIFRFGITSIVTVFCVLLFGCGSGALVPSIDQVLPQSITVGTPTQTIQIVGRNFGTKPVALWNGEPVATTIVNATTVSAVVTSEALAAVATAQVEILDPIVMQRSAKVPVTVSARGNNSTLVITTAALSSGTLGSTYSQTLQASGGTSAYSWAVTSGKLPAGLALTSTNGVISGTPTTTGTSTFTVSVTDSSRPVQTQSAVLSIPVSNPPLSVSSAALASGATGVAYSQSLQASGGTPGYSWAIISGNLPAGLSLSPSTGLISGAPTTAGTFGFVFKATDSGSPAQSMSSQGSIVVTQTVTPQTVPPIAITAATLAGETVNTSYSQSLQATGGTPVYTWSVISGSLPAGLTISPATGVISGTATTVGTYSFVLKVTDSGKPAQTQSVSTSITVTPAPLAISSSTLAAGTIGASYSRTMTASGGTPGYKWSIVSGALPPGLSLTGSTGVISGTPAVAGTFSFNVSLTDSGSPAQSKSAQTSIVVTPTALAITSSSLASATASSPYSQSLASSGGTPSYNWSIASGALPAGLTLTPATGLISGTPTASGTFAFTASVSDSGSPAQSKSAQTSIVVVPTALAITSSSLASATASSPYSQSLAASGGTPGYTWSISSGALPAGLTLVPATGLISGTPTASGTFAFTASVSDSGSPAQSKSAQTSIVVAPTALAITSSSLAAAKASSPYSQSLAASGGTPGYTWSIGSGALPAGLTLAPATGLISGTPTASGMFAFTASVSDSGNPAQTKSATTSIVVTTASSPLSITSSTLTSEVVNAAYSQALQATGGTPGYTWSMAPGSLPSGLNLSSTGVISGTATSTGIYYFNVTASDSGSPVQSKTALVSITVAPSGLAITASSLANGTKGTSYSQSFQATGGSPAYTWAITSGSLPAGLQLTASSGTISGTPSATGTFSFTAAVADTSSPTQTKSVNTAITISSSALAITSSTLAAGTINSAYSQALQASGGTPGYTWSITSGSLPAGLQIAASTGLISGTPTGSGTASFTATVTDSGSPSQTKSVNTSIAVSGSGLTITSSSLSAGVTGTSYSQSLQASGGTTSYTWSIASGTLPAGLQLASSGVISGTPTASGTFPLTVMVTDSSSPAQSKTASTSLVVGSPALAITSSSFVSGTNGVAFAQSLAANGGTPAYTWSISAGSLPAGLTLAATTGVISGTPSANGTFSFTAKVTDNSTPTQSQTASTSIVVAAATVAGPGNTWYIRPDGGTRYSAHATGGQCDGLSDSPYLGVGTNQHCAFNDYRYLWDDQSYNNNAWVIAGGDTVILRGGPWRVGWDSNTGAGAGWTWCLGGSNGPCTNPTIPAGTASQHTRILGENFGACNATNKTQIFGGYGVYTAMNLSGAQYVDVECLEVTRHSDCIFFGSPAYPAHCNTDTGSGALSDFDSDGIQTSATTHDLLLQDMWIHGHIGRGIKGPIGANVTCLRCDIAFNGGAGWDFDDGTGPASVFGPNASWNFLYSTIEWSGCNQQYPAVDTVPVASCYSQSTGGYGDGVGTPAGTGTGMSVVVDHSIFRYNTQDGIDLGHMDGWGNQSGVQTLSITSSQAYGNSGGQFKWGAYFQTAVFTNNVAVANCLRLSVAFPGAPSNYNTNLGDFCRANDGESFDLLQGSTLLFANNTFANYAPTSFDIACWSPSCSNTTFTFENNVTIGYDNPTTYNMGGQAGGPGDFWYQETIGNVIRKNNLWYGMRNTKPSNCPATEICTSPLLVGQPSGNASNFVESELDNFNFTPSPGSPAVGAGITVPSVTLDYNGTVRPNPPSIGAIE